MNEYVLLVYQNYDNRYFVMCETLERAQKLGKVYKKGGANEVLIIKNDYVEHVF